ncbi:MAG: hypothetical protein FWC01_02410 [Treponema sp.]|nr:hypothetical protein [Treponema sp.]MCL2237121.1 hypothetical protein [Treponema sp.]
MCPDPQILSIHVDGELPSPWNEKMESHLKSCPECREKFENFKRLHELFKKDNTVKRRYVERVVDEPAGERVYTEDEMRERVWNRIKKQRPQKPRVWRRRLSIPLPAAAAAAIIIALVAGLWIRGETFFQKGFPNRQDAAALTEFNFTVDEEIPNLIPASDLNGVIQYLSSDGAEIIILRLPESSNFSRIGEPAIVRAADYQKDAPRRNP